MASVAAQSVTSAVAVGEPTPAAGRRVGRVRWARLASAPGPGALRLWSLVLVGAMVALWAVGFAAVAVRQNAVTSVHTTAGPAFVAAQRIHADLSEADASAAGAFLAGGVEPAAQRAAYDAGVSSATGQVLELAQAGVPAREQRALTDLAAQIPVYTGLVEHARAENRLGFAVGGAYLRQASTLMQGTILPAADRLAALDAGRVDDGYHTATGPTGPIAVTMIGLAALAGLVAVQVAVARRAHRLVNVALLAATVATLTAVVWTLVSFTVERSRLADARDQGFVPMTIVAQARVLGLRAWGDSSLSLIAHGDGQDADADAVAAAARLGYDANGHPTGHGVLPAAAALGGPDAATRSSLDADWRAYQTTALQVRSLASGVGGFQQAVRLALGEGTTSFGRYDHAADQALSASQQRFEARVASAGDGLRGVAVAASVLLALAALLVLVGLQTRINEYR